MSTARWKPAESRSGESYAAVVIPAAAGRTATAMRPAARATSLFTAEAMPACVAGAELSAVDVSGATVTHSPRPSTTTAGSTWTR
ncbi:hypothetical protein [Dactylosporangium darangshiense]|uniref:hypothetical protein n=1 Tax=Dactylosporangium darangshiense TaxID=579108 RepID=UPI003637793E